MIEKDEEHEYEIPRKESQFQNAQQKIEDIASRLNSLAVANLNLGSERISLESITNALVKLEEEVKMLGKYSMTKDKEKQMIAESFDLSRVALNELKGEDATLRRSAQESTVNEVHRLELSSTEQDKEKKNEIWIH